MIKHSKLRTTVLGLAVLVLYGAFFVAVQRWGTEKVPFSKAGWQNKADLGDRWPMAQNLAETGYLRGMTEPEVVQMLGKEDAREVHRNAESPDDLSLTYVAQHFGLALSKQFEIAYKPFPKIAICHQCSEQEIL